jgi:hypothetical protein
MAREATIRGARFRPFLIPARISAGAASVRAAARAAGHVLAGDVRARRLLAAGGPGALRAQGGWSGGRSISPWPCFWRSKRRAPARGIPARRRTHASISRRSSDPAANRASGRRVREHRPDPRSPQREQLAYRAGNAEQYSGAYAAGVLFAVESTPRSALILPAGGPGAPLPWLYFLTWRRPCFSGLRNANPAGERHAPRVMRSPST